MMVVMDDRFVLDHDHCYRAAQSRDARFDGWFFTAVRTTGIYCRPSCPAITPKQSNCEFFRTAAAAQQNGYRACKRCRPDATPGSPEWDVRSDLVGRAMRLIADGVVDREGVTGLAARLHYSERHLNRLLTTELGAGPIALARAQRAQTARILIETSELSMTDIAFAAGFGSVRQFNDTVREVYALSPTELRGRTGSGGGRAREAGTVSVRLALRPPFAAAPLLAFLGDRAIPGVEAATAGGFARTLDLPHGYGTVDVTIGADTHVKATFHLSDWHDLAPAVRRVRRLLDLDADPVAIDEVLSTDDTMGRLVAAWPGLRSAGSVDAAETVVRAIVGQQVSVAGASTVLGRISANLGEPLPSPVGDLAYLFPSMERLAAAPTGAFPMPTRRADTIRRVAERIAGGTLMLDVGIDREHVVEQLTAVTGIGPWTAQYVMMRGLGHPDVFLATDLGVRHAVDALGIDASVADTWRPWRSYAVHHLWATLSTAPFRSRKEPT
jgi:AraC family transcriptional regulator of adaptative response / DNA-3-methyladenine glycosylase II